MRDDLSFQMIPIVQDSLNTVCPTGIGSNVATNISANVYYGYQPMTAAANNNHNGTPVQDSDMDFQFSNQMEIGADVQTYHNTNPPFQNVNRKRRCEFANGYFDFKKRREQEFLPPIPENTAPLKPSINIRKPTHNLPDLPRCLMGHFV